MRGFCWVLAACLLAGCQAEPPPGPGSGLPEQVVFSSWPSVTEKPIPVGPVLWAWCRGPTPEEVRARAEQARKHGPHAEHTIVVRVSPEALDAFRARKPLPVGAVVVKEKYLDRQGSGPLQEYALMVKRESGYDPGGGDWEYAYVTLQPEKKVQRGLTGCVGCHASVKDRDYLYRDYGGARE